MQDEVLSLDFIDNTYKYMARAAAFVPSSVSLGGD